MCCICWQQRVETCFGGIVDVFDLASASYVPVAVWSSDLLGSAPALRVRVERASKQDGGHLGGGAESSLEALGVQRLDLSRNA